LQRCEVNLTPFLVDPVLGRTMIGGPKLELERVCLEH
jgi:hypothetical protein